MIIPARSCVAGISISGWLLVIAIGKPRFLSTRPLVSQPHHAVAQSIAGDQGPRAGVWCHEHQQRQASRSRIADRVAHAGWGPYRMAAAGIAFLLADAKGTDAVEDK